MFILMTTMMASVPIPVHVPIPRTIGNGVLQVAPGGADPNYYNKTFIPLEVTA